MARKPTITRDKDNISSKLLGTNIADINVQKFREVITPPPFKIKGPLTPDLVKTITGKFSFDIIFVLNLQGQGLLTIQALANCRELIVLNLSRNTLQSLQPLNSLLKLQILNVSHNRLSHFLGLENHGQLHTANCLANSVESVNQLVSLKSCDNLRNLGLRSLAGEEANPICDRVEYRKAVFEYLPQLLRLDYLRADTKIDAKEIPKSKREIKLDIGKVPALLPDTLPLPTPKINMSKTPDQDKCQSQMRQLNSQLSTLQTKLRLLSM